MKHLFISALFFLSVTVMNLSAADNIPASFDPPGGLSVDSVPVFVVLGFDDNRYVDGVDWTLDLLAGYKNPEGTGNPETFDGADLKASFYFISSAIDDDTFGGQPLIDAWKRIVTAGHEIGDHTITHNTSKATSLADWQSEIRGCRTTLYDILGVDSSNIYGFRTPYLDFNEATFEAVSTCGLLYECTMTQMQDYNKSQFAWPYTLDSGFTAKTITGWEGKCKIPGLWELPVYCVGVDKTTMWPPITGFDSSILTQASGNKYEEMLKNGIDYRLASVGNRCPMTVGLHTDTYSELNPDGYKYDGALDLAGRRAALKNFIEYALTKPQVRFVTGKQLINWMRNPVPLGREKISANKNSVSGLSKSSVSNISLTTNGISFTSAHNSNMLVSVYSVSGKRIASEEVSSSIGSNFISLGQKLTGGVYIVKVNGVNSSICVTSKLHVE